MPQIFDIVDKKNTKGSMTGLQSNIIWEYPLRTSINVEVNLRYCMTLNRRRQGHM